MSVSQKHHRTLTRCAGYREELGRDTWYRFNVKKTHIRYQVRQDHYVSSHHTRQFLSCAMYRIAISAFVNIFASLFVSSTSAWHCTCGLQVLIVFLQVRCILRFRCYIPGTRYICPVFLLRGAIVNRTKQILLYIVKIGN